MTRVVRDEPGDEGFAETYAALPDETELQPWLGWCVQAGNPVLYVGPGTGRIALPLWRAGVRLVGVERHPGMIRRLAQRLPEMEVVQADFITADLGDRSFELVLGPSSIFGSAAMLAAAERWSRHWVGLELMNPHWLGGPGRGSVRLDWMTEGEAHIGVPYSTGDVQEATVTLRWPERIEDHLAAAGLELEWMGSAGGRGLQESPTYFVLSAISARRDL